MTHINCIWNAAYSMNHTKANSNGVESINFSMTSERFAKRIFYIYTIRTFDFSILIFDLVDQTALERPIDFNNEVHN